MRHFLWRSNPASIEIDLEVPDTDVVPGRYYVANLTPHPLTTFGEDDTVLVTIPASGIVARAEEQVVVNGTYAIGRLYVP